MNTIASYNKWKSSKFIGVLCVYTAIVVCNILSLGNSLNLLLTIPQYAIVFFFLFSGDFKKAVLLHFSFFILSLSAQKTLGMLGEQELVLFNYGTIKLIGPIRASYMVNIIMVFICFGQGLKPRKDILFYKLFKVFLIIGGIATVIGLLGLVVHPYYTFSGFINPVIYMFVVISTCYVLLCVASDDFIKDCYYLSLISTMAGVLASYLCFAVFGVVSSYSVFDIVYCADCMWFASILVAGLVSIKEKIPLYITLAVFILISINVMEGKSVFNLAFAVCCLAYYVFIDRSVKSKHQKEASIIRPLLIIGVIAALTKVTLSNDSMVMYKLQSAISIFSFDLEDISNSPYIRIASLLNILYEDIQNPFTLIFGNGYGGFFRDNLHLFSGLDLSRGAWPDDVISTGRFPNGHDTIVNVPFYNGLIGVYLICKISYQYIKRIKYNYMNSVAFMWILLILYFNTIFAVMGAFFLLGAEMNVNDYSPTHSENKHSKAGI